MFCSNCGKEISNDSSFCMICGNKIEKNIHPSQPPPIAPQPSGLPPTTPPPATPHQAPLPPSAPPLTPPPMDIMHHTAPIYHGTPVNVEKKKNKLLLPLIIVGVVVFLAIGVISVLFINKKLNERNNESTSNEGRNITAETKEDIKTDNSNNGASESDDTDNNLGNNEIPQDKTVEDETVEIDIIDDTEILFEPLYNYVELPYVLSMDSYLKFSYVDYFPLSDSSVYSYQYNDVNATEADFYKACEDYSLLLQELSGFTYEADFSNQKYEETGLLANYLTKDDYAISITAGVEDLGYFAYITIYILTDEVEGGNITGNFEMPNYNYFLANRETISFTYNHDVYMDNGISFYIYEVMGNYTEDGTVVMDVILDISSYYTDYYFNNGDFFMIPFDAENNVLSDAVPVGMVLDEAGNEVAMPFLLSSSSYDTYTFYFQVPNETYSLLFYATNVLNDDYSYPAYVMQVGN
ncbi:MAG: zinc ribbon domain-containing protein [Anaerolineaceae bacterium]|nr:MAG: zinc ribbon domain-containing protein [Anaerolineaceae bacterium]